MSKLNIKVMNFAKGQELPEFKENRNGQWVDYGSDNMYPQYLIEVFHKRSNKHKAIINRKVDMIAGGGFQPVAGAESFFNNDWGKYSLDTTIVKSSTDYEIANGFALFVRWNGLGDKVVSYEHLPWHKARISPCGKKVLISKDWGNVRKAENKPVEYPIFNPRTAKDEPIQVLYHIKEAAGIDYYPMPYYSSSLVWIELDYEIGNFHLSSVRNGFMPSFILNFATGIPTEEEMDAVYRDFEKKYTGSENAGKFILAFSEGTEQQPTLTPIQLNDSDERFIMLHKEMMEEIFIGHGVTDPQLFGVRVAGELGGKDELLQNLAIFQSVYVDKRQRELESVYNKLFRFAGFEGNLKLNKYAINFDNVEKNDEQ